MEWKKAPEELVEFITNKMKGVKCDYRKMFGYPAYFVNGNMFAGIFGDKLFLRLSVADITEITKSYKDVTTFEPMRGRPVKGYVFIPKAVYSDDAVFDKWLKKSIKYVTALPPKQKRK